MKVNIIEDEPKSFILEFEGADRSIAEIIKDALIDNKDVEFVAVVREHPEIGYPRLVVKTTKNAASIVTKAVDQVQKDLNEFSSKLPKK
jgi:DNA-directed RNA polymerase subunit L